MKITVTEEMRELVTKVVGAQALAAMAADTRDTASLKQAWSDTDEAALELGRLVAQAVEAEDDRHEDEALREYAAETLCWLMRDISEEHYCAGWLIGLEHSLWEIATTPRRSFGMADVPENRVKLLQLLAEEARGWWVWDNEEQRERFVATDEWLRMYAAAEKEAGE